MRCTTFALLAACILPQIVGSVPFAPRDSLLQRNRRRAIDYPLSPHPQHRADRQDGRRRRRGAPYSVVQVDGSSPTNQGGGVAGSPATFTVFQTVTESAASHVSTEIVEITSIVQHSQSPVTVVVTTTVKHGLTPDNTATPSSEPHPIVEAGAQVQTIVRTVTAALPSATTTQFYDNGLWHTSYAVKTFTSSVIPTTTTTTSTSASLSSAAASSSSLLSSNALDSSTTSTGSASWARPGTPTPAAPLPAQSQSSPLAIHQPNNWNLTRTEINGLQRYRP